MKTALSFTFGAMLVLSCMGVAWLLNQLERPTHDDSIQPDFIQGPPQVLPPLERWKVTYEVYSTYVCVLPDRTIRCVNSLDEEPKPDFLRSVNGYSKGYNCQLVDIQVAAGWNDPQ